MNLEEISEYIDSYIVMLNLTYDYNFFSNFHNKIHDESDQWITIRVRKDKEVYSLKLFDIRYDFQDRIDVIVEAEYTEGQRIKNICRELQDFKDTLINNTDISIKLCEITYGRPIR